MAYATYTTDAIVCGAFEHNTADRRYLLLTREAGMIAALARSVREERSRQRFALQEFALIRVSLVKGKQGWRIGSVEARDNFYHRAVDQAARGSVVGVVRLVRRFMQGEEPDAQLYTSVERGLRLLAGPLSERSRQELLLKLRILGSLGYVDPTVIPSEEANAGHVEDAPDVTHLNRLFERAVSSSQL